MIEGLVAVSNNTEAMSRVFLPDDLISEVLLFLPIKSLMRLRCVCKSWKTLLSDSTFVELHFHRSATTRHMAVIKYEEGYNAITFPLSHLVENQSITIANNSYYRSEFKDVITRVVDSCNGLICLVSHFNTTVHKNFWFHIWNPATRTLSKKIGSFQEHLERLPIRLNFAFGYDKSNRTYKVAALCSSELKVFNLDDNIWRTISSFPSFDVVNTRSSSGVNEGVNLNGTVNWLSIYRKFITIEKYAIISLDLGTETYRQLLPPPGVDEVPPYVDPTIVVLMDCLCFSHHPNFNDFVIWKMTEFGVEKSWTQFLKINFQNLQGVDKCSGSTHYKLFLFPLCLSEDGYTLILANSRIPEAILYNLRDHTVEEASGDAIIWCYSKDYVQSLASIC